MSCHFAGVGCLIAKIFVLVELAVGIVQANCPFVALHFVDPLHHLSGLEELLYFDRNPWGNI